MMPSTATPGCVKIKPDDLLRALLHKTKQLYTITERKSTGYVYRVRWTGFLMIFIYYLMYSTASVAAM